MPPAFFGTLQLKSYPHPTTANGKLDACYSRKAYEIIDLGPGLSKLESPI
jgi:hypothetical protein